MPTSCQREIWEDVDMLVGRFEKAPRLRPREAARALLRHKSGYSDAESILMPYQKGRVSLPASAHDCPRTRDVLAEAERL